MTTFSHETAQRLARYNPADASSVTASPTPRRILFVDHTAALGGGEIALLHLIQNIDKARFTPVVVLCEEGPLAVRLRQANVETYILPLSSSVIKSSKNSLNSRSLLRIGDIMRLSAYVLRLARVIKSHRIDLVHTNSLKSDIFGGFAAKMTRTPLLWHIHDRIMEDYLPKPIVGIFRTLCRIVPNYIVANSHATLNSLCLPAKNAGVAVHCGVDTEKFTAYDTVATRWEAADQDGTRIAKRPTIGMVGRLSSWKGQHIFLQAAAVVRARFPEARFQIVGAALFDEEAYEAEIRRLCTALGLDDSVEFTGFQADIPGVLAEMDILVHASTTGEPFGLVVAEGMAAGKPVVATDGGGIPEIVINGRTGLLVPMGDAGAMADALLELLENPDQAHLMGARGCRRIREHFTIEHTAQKIQAVYEEMLDSRLPLENCALVR